MKKTCPILFFLTVMCLGSSYGQLETHRWYFTETTNKGILFNYGTNIPALITEHINPYALEGSGIANNPNDGSLMFYSTGDKMLDKNHMVMPNGNGLISHFSTAQKGIICPKPGNCNQYYVFHNNSAVEVAVGNYYYSLVDLSLPGNGTIPVPLGDVVAGQKNIFLKANVGESSVIIKSTQTNKYWLVISTFDANEMAVFKIDSVGITATGSYNIPTTITDFRNLKFSYEAGKIALISGRENEATVLMDFNRTTGIISGVMNIPGTPVGSDPTYFNGMYDGEWSADGTKFYIGKWRVPGGGTGGQIYQYNLNTPATNASVIYSVTGNTSNILGALKRGPDGKIYFGYNHQTFAYRYLGVINNPNAAGASCNPVSLGFDLGSDVGLWGKFPDHLPSNYKPTAINDTVDMNCSDTSVNFVPILTNDSDLDDDQFNLIFFNIPSYVNITINPNQTINIDLDSLPTGTINIPYQLCDLKCFNKCDTAYLVININTVPGSFDFLQNDTIVCNENPITLIPSLTGDSYLWNNGETTQSILVNASGVYELTITTGGCSYTDSIIVFEANSPVVDLGLDTTICEEYVILDATYPNSTYLWNNGSIVPQIPVTVAGSYFVTVTNICGSGSDTILVNTPTPIDFLENDTVGCNGDSIALSPSIIGDSYLWNTSETSSFIFVNAAGIYSLQITLNGCPYSDSITVLQINAPDVNLGPDTVVCEGDYIILSATSASSDYIWNTGATISQILVNTDGIYYVEVFNDCGNSSDTIEVLFDSYPLLDLGMDTTICDDETYALTAFWPGSNILWSTGDTIPVISVNATGTYWATITNDCGTITDSVNITLIKCGSGIDDLSSSVQLYPNPASEYIYTTSHHLDLHLLNANLISLDGKNITLNAISQTSQGYYFNLGEIASGMYMLSLVFEEGNVNKKVIIRR